MAAPAVERCHHEAAWGFLKRGVLRLYGLRLRGRVIAVLYAFARGPSVYYYLSGFDPEFKALSPGTLLIAHAIEEAISAGAEQFDFLRGREAYKYWWGAEDRVIYRRVLRPLLGSRTTNEATIHSL